MKAVINIPCRFLFADPSEVAKEIVIMGLLKFTSLPRVGDNINLFMTVLEDEVEVKHVEWRRARNGVFFPEIFTEPVNVAVIVAGGGDVLLETSDFLELVGKPGNNGGLVFVDVEGTDSVDLWDGSEKKPKNKTVS